jgi:hypothetical protein
MAIQADDTQRTKGGTLSKPNVPGSLSYPYRDDCAAVTNRRLCFYLDR